jgi:signal transduction histidine kinase
MRRNLALVSVAVTTMVVLAFLVPLAGLVRELARDRVLIAAERDAQLLAQFITANPDRDPADALGLFARTDELADAPVSIILPDGSTVGASVPADRATQFAPTSAFRVAEPGGEAVYVPAVTGAGDVAVVRVFVGDEELGRNVVRSWLVLGGLGLVMIAIAVAAADQLGRSTVRSASELSEAAGRLGRGDLAAQVDPSGPPELVEVGHEFNRLALRIRMLLQRERETAADLSHRLRTPLMAVRLDAEALPASAEPDALLADLAELERTVDHLIREARRPAGSQEEQAADVAAVARERMAFWKVLGEEQGRSATLSIDAPEPVVVPLARDDLEVVLDALLGNVFAHTSEGTDYRLSVTLVAGDRVRLAVEDGGPGFGIEDPLTRGRSGSGSTGLGLDVVRRTAETVGGSVTTGSSPLGGALIAVDLPATGG